MADERFRPSQIDPEAQRQAEEDAPSIADGPLPQRGRSRLFSDDISFEWPFNHYNYIVCSVCCSKKKQVHPIKTSINLN